MDIKTNKRQNQHCRLAKHSLNSFFGAFLSVSLLTTLLCLPHCKNDDNNSPACPTEDSGFNKGDGMADSPFLICSRSQLEKISMGLDKHYELSQNIDLQDDPFTPLSANIDPDTLLSDPFTGSLDGKGYELRNLKIAVDTQEAGLFANLGSGGSIQNLGIVGLDVTSTNTDGDGLGEFVRIGALAAQMSGGEIKNCYALDSDDDPDLYGSVVVPSGEGNYDYVGGLVGEQNDGSIIGSYANGNAYGGEGIGDAVGGLVGWQSDGSIIGSYANGNAYGGEGNSDFVGGLVGYQNNGSIIASYATGNANGGGGDADYVGGLVGRQNDGSIIASYATGNADGGVGGYDAVGGLLGWRDDGNIIASYATGNADGEEVGDLLGRSRSSASDIEESYGFGEATGGTEVDPPLGTPYPTDVTMAEDLTAANSGATMQWLGLNSPWDFGTGSQIPALRYVTGATLLGSIVTYECAASKLPAGLNCGDLLAGQSR